MIFFYDLDTYESYKIFFEKTINCVKIQELIIKKCNKKKFKPLNLI